MPSTDLPIPGPAASTTDSTGVGPAAGAGTFTALLRQHGGGLRAGPAGATADETRAGADDGDALAGVPVSATSLPLGLLPPVESVVSARPLASHYPAELKQLPARPAGGILPSIGNALPQRLESQVTATAEAAAHDPLRTPTPTAQTSDQGSAVTAEPELTSRSAPGLDPSGAFRLRAEGASALPGALELEYPVAAATAQGARVHDPQASVPVAQLLARARQNPVSVPWSKSSDPGSTLPLAGYTEDGRAETPVSGAQSLAAAVRARYNSESLAPSPVQSDSATRLPLADSPVVGMLPGGQAPITGGAEVVSPLPGTGAGGAPGGPPGGISRTVEAPFGSSSWSGELAGHLRSLAGEGNLQRAELRLNPAHLGPIEVRLSLRGDETNVTFVAGEGVVREALQETLPRLRELLAEQGLNLGQTRVLDQHSANHGEREAAYRQFAGKHPSEAADSSGSKAGLVAESSRPSSDRSRSLIDAYI